MQKATCLIPFHFQNKKSALTDLHLDPLNMCANR